MAKSVWHPSQSNMGNINELTEVLRSMTATQRAALRSATENNKDVVQKSRTAGVKESAYYQFAQAIKELTNEDGTVNYDPDRYQFNPYSGGVPDEMARKAFESLSYKDQLMLEIDDNGKPATPDFGDPNVDTSVYDRYQQALLRVEAETQREADAKATKAMEDLYKRNRGSWDYDPAADAKALKKADKNISLTQTELEDVYKNLAEQYDWDDEAYNAWANPEATQPPASAAKTAVETGTQAVKDKEKAGKKVSFTGVLDAITGKSNLDAAKAQYDAGQAAVAAANPYTEEEIAQATKDRDDYVRARGTTAFMKTINKLTGKDTVEYYLQKNRSDGKAEQLATDAKHITNQTVQGIGDFVSGVATLAGLAMKRDIDTMLMPAWLITNEGKRWTMEEAREKFGALDTIMYIAETSGSGAGNAYNAAGAQDASGTAQFIGGLARSFMASMTSGIAGAALGAAAPALTKTFDLSAKLEGKAPKAVQTLAKVVPTLEVGVNQVPFLTQAFGGGYQEAKGMGYDEAGSLVWGSWTALAEGIPEAISWNWSAATGSSLRSQVHGAINKGAAKNATKRGLKNLMAAIGDSGAARILTSMNAEGMSEVVSNYLDAFGRNVLMGQDVDAPTMMQNLETYASGALLSAITQGYGYATESNARKQAEAIVAGMMNGQPPTAEQVQALDDANNEEAAKLPLTNEQLDEAAGEGLRVDTKIVEDYRVVNDALTKAERATTANLQRLQQMNAQGVPFGSPERVAAVKAFTSSRKELASAIEKRKAVHGRYLSALDGMVADTEKAAAEAEAAQQQVEQEYAQWQYAEQLQNDPQGVMTVTQELLTQVQDEIAQQKAALNAYGMRGDPATRMALMNQIKSLEESAAKLQQMQADATAAIAPTIVEEPTSEDSGANAPPENGTPTQGATSETEEAAQEFVATMRQRGATTEEIIRSVEEQAAAEGADESDIAYAEAVKAIVSTNTPSLAQTLVTSSGSRASEKTVTDLLNRARQEGTDEAGIAVARELLVNTGAVDNSAEAIKTALRTMNIAPTAQEREAIAAAYGSYDGYRRAVAGVVPLGGQNRANSVSIDQAIGALQEQFPGQVTGDDRISWLYEFAKNNPKGRINYDGDLDADSAQLWGEIKADNSSFFSSRDAAPSFAVPDFASKETSVSKEAAVQWVRDTVSGGGNAEEIRAYAQRRRYTEVSAKGRQFWGNVLEATQAPSVQAFKLSPDEGLARDTVHLFTGTSPYTQGNGLQMQMESSTYRTNRKWSALKNDLQQIVGFTFNDEFYNRQLRRRGAIAYFEPAHNFVSTSDTNNMTALLHEAGHALRLENIDPTEVGTFLQGMPATFLAEYDPRVHTAEAGAEMFRAWMLNPDSMERYYPNTFAGLQRNLGRRRYGQLRENGNAIRRMLGADPSTKVNAALQNTTDKQPVNIRQKLRDAVQKTMDSGLGLKKIDRAAQRAGIAIEGGGADARASQARTASQAVEALFFDGMYDRNGNRVACSLAECIQGLRSEQQMLDFNAYVELKQALDRYERNPDDWVFSRDVCTVAEAQAFVAGIENTQTGQSEIVTAANNLWAWLRTYRDTQLSTAIPQDVKNTWESLNPYYIPQTRSFTSDIHAAVRGGGVGGQGTGVNRRRVGSTRDIVSPIDAIANMVARTKSAAMKHDVLTALQNYYDHDANGVIGSFMHEIEPNLVPHVVPADVIRRSAVGTLEQAGLEGQDAQLINDVLEQNLEDGVVFELRAPEGRVGDAIAITENGATRYFQITDQDLLNALTNMPAPQLSGILGGTQKVSSMINGLITAKNPAFALGNAARDIQEAYFTGSTQNPVVFMWDYLGALVDVVGDTPALRALADRTGLRIGNAENVQQYRAMGGSGGLSSVYASSKNINDLKRAMFGSAGDSRNVGKLAMDRLGDAIESFNGGIETIPRLAEYKRQLRRGASYADAIKAAKNCTTDFSTHGSSSKTDGALWRFFNASMQSTYKAANLFVDGSASPQNRRRMASQLTSMLLIGVVGRAVAEFLLQANDDDDTYAAMPDYIKDGYWVIPTDEKGKYVRIPLPNGALMTAVNSFRPQNWNGCYGHQ